MLPCSMFFRGEEGGGEEKETAFIEQHAVTAGKNILNGSDSR